MEKPPFLILEQPADAAIEQVTGQIRSLGFQTTLTFDLQDARHAQVACACPHHRTENCACQLVVILVYGPGPRPVTLIAHGYEGKTWFSFADVPQQHASWQMETLLLRSFAPMAKLYSSLARVG